MGSANQLEMAKQLRRIADALEKYNSVNEPGLCPHGYPVWCHTCEAHHKNDLYNLEANRR